MISVVTEIGAPPRIVRDVLLDFAKLSEWHTEFMLSVEPDDKSITHGRDLREGDRLTSKISGMQFNQTVLENSERAFKTVGPTLLLTGTHVYIFEDSTEIPGGTRFTQSEEFSGPFSLFMWPRMPGGISTAAGFASFNRDIKIRSEALALQ